MGHFDRLQLAARVTYYLGWISLLSGALFHYNIGKSFFLAIHVSQRNLFEISVALFVICLASGVRALAAKGNEVPVVLRKQVAA
ncbi:MAG: hypothetical protein WB421_02030 [Terriglobales bacterium]